MKFSIYFGICSMFLENLLAKHYNTFSGCFKKTNDQQIIDLMNNINLFELHLENLFCSISLFASKESVNQVLRFILFLIYWMMFITVHQISNINLCMHMLDSWHEEISFNFSLSEIHWKVGLNVLLRFCWIYTVLLKFHFFLVFYVISLSLNLS